MAETTAPLLDGDVLGQAAKLYRVLGQAGWTRSDIQRLIDDPPTRSCALAAVRGQAEPIPPVCWPRKSLQSLLRFSHASREDSLSWLLGDVLCRGGSRYALATCDEEMTQVLWLMYGERNNCAETAQRMNMQPREINRIATKALAAVKEQVRPEGGSQ